MTTYIKQQSAEFATYEPTSAEIQTALAENLIRAIPSASFNLGILYLLLTLAHTALLAPEHKGILVPVAAASAAIFFTGWAITRTGNISGYYAHAIAGLFGIIALINSVLHVAITGDPLQSSNIMLVMVAVGAFFLSSAWFWITIGLAFFGWLAIALNYTIADAWLHFAIGIAMAVLVATIVNRLRLSTYSNLYKLQLQHDHQRTKLENAQALLEERVVARTAELGQVNRTLQAEVERRRKTETALKQSEHTLLNQRENLQQIVAQQTEELRNANHALRETAELKAELIDEIRYDLQPHIHEIRSKLRILESGLTGKLTERQRATILATQELSSELLQTINNIKTVTHMNVDELKIIRSSVQVATLCQTVMSSVRYRALSHKVTLSLSIDPLARSVRADNQQIRQTLITLLNNAIAFAPQGGQAGIIVQGQPSKGELHFVVWDNGNGLTSEQKQNLLNPTALLNKGHHGGQSNLALAEKLIKMHGGQLRIQSAPGAGSVFVVSLPWEQGNVIPSVAHSAEFAGQTPTTTQNDSKTPAVIERLMRSLHIT